MSRRIGAYVQFDEDALRRLREIPEEMIDRVEDKTPVMAVIATEDLKPEMIGNLADRGDGSWPAKDLDTIKRWGNLPLGVGQHGGFAPTIQRSWSKNNAVAFTRAPHAHLFEGGTDRWLASGEKAPRWGWREKESHTVTRGKTRGQETFNRRRSRADAQGRGKTKWTSAGVHQPARPFAYIGEEVRDRATRRLAAFLVEEPYRGTV